MLTKWSERLFGIWIIADFIPWGAAAAYTTIMQDKNKPINGYVMLFLLAAGVAVFIGHMLWLEFGLKFDDAYIVMVNAEIAKKLAEQDCTDPDKAESHNTKSEESSSSKIIPFQHK